MALGFQGQSHSSHLTAVLSALGGIKDKTTRLSVSVRTVLSVSVKVAQLPQQLCSVGSGTKSHLSQWRSEEYWQYVELQKRGRPRVLGPASEVSSETAQTAASDAAPPTLRAAAHVPIAKAGATLCRRRWSTQAPSSVQLR